MKITDLSEFCKKTSGKNSELKKVAKVVIKLMKKILQSNESKEILYPILKGASIQLLKALLPKGYGPQRSKKQMMIATLLNPIGK